MSRGALYMQHAGSPAKSKFISDKMLKEILEKYKLEHNVDFKMSKDVYEIIRDSVTSNLNNLFKACPKTSKKLTSTMIYKVLNKSDQSFAHMSFVWKQGRFASPHPRK
jgi:hypothetical protein